MATITTLPFTLGAPAEDWQKPAQSGKLSPSASLPIYPAGPSYISAARRRLKNLSFAEDDAHVASHQASLAASRAAEDGAELYPGLGEEKEDRRLLEMDAKEWKKQDHYAVLGLSKLRYLATNDQIIVAHRRKVLRHHPDKKAGGSSGTNDDNFFKCIQKAFEILMNPEKRRQYDSVDPEIEDEVPNPKEVKADDFCKVYGPVFAREGRFSKRQPVPVLGAMDASKAEVEGFYDFWYNFDSWRSFEYHDKEANEGSDSRDEKRFTEKKNKADRAKAKKEDITRVRELVDMVLAADPRIKRIKAEEKAARDAKKNKGGAAGGSAAAGKALTPAQKKAEAEKKAAEEKQRLADEKKKAEEDKVAREAAKKAREAAKKNLKKWKKAIATVVAASNYFQPEGTSASATVIEKQLAEIDALAEVLEPEEIRELKEQVEKAGAGPAAKAAIVDKANKAGEKEEGKGKFSEFA